MSNRALYAQLPELWRHSKIRRNKKFIELSSMDPSPDAVRPREKKIGQNEIFRCPDYKQQQYHAKNTMNSQKL